MTYDRPPFAVNSLGGEYRVDYVVARCGIRRNYRRMRRNGFERDYARFAITDILFSAVIGDMHYDGKHVSRHTTSH